MTAPGIQERLRLARLELFAVTGATHQWSVSEDVNPIPGLREDVLALLRGQQEEAQPATASPEVRDFYVSGPMTGLPEFNYPAFAAATKRLRDGGGTVWNPAENFAGRTDMQYCDYICEDVAQVMRSRAVVVLPGWEKSKGAALEVHLARVLGLPVLADVTMHPIPASGDRVPPESPLTTPEDFAEAVEHIYVGVCTSQRDCKALVDAYRKAHDAARTASGAAPLAAPQAIPDEVLTALASVGIEPPEDESAEWTLATEPMGPQPVGNSLREALHALVRHVDATRSNQPLAAPSPNGDDLKAYDAARRAFPKHPAEWRVFADAAPKAAALVMAADRLRGAEQ